MSLIGKELGDFHVQAFVNGELDRKASCRERVFTGV